MVPGTILGFADKVSGVAADFVAVEHMDHPKLLNGRVAELGKRNVNQTATKTTGQFPPTRARRQGR